MSFILAEQRDNDPSDAWWKAYQRYVEENHGRFPVGALELVTSDWYFNFSDHRCPHDSWLEMERFGETVSHRPNFRRTKTEERSEARQSCLTVRLLGAYHNGYIELHYPRVYSLALSAPNLNRGLGDWRYDEFRISDTGNLVHEIEWSSFEGDSRWLIEASDVQFKWIYPTTNRMVDRAAHPSL